MLTDRYEYFVTILPDEQIQLRQDRVILENGVEIQRLHHRQVLGPGQDVSQLPMRIQMICGLLWTPTVIRDFQADQIRRKQLPGTL